TTCFPSGGGQYCGKIGNGCGGTMECGECPPGQACGADGLPGVCPYVPPDGGACTGLQCRIEVCDGGAKTTLSGTVYDPAGLVPLYDVLLYVPNAPLDPLSTGPSCDRCDSPVSGQPVTATLSDANGQFKLRNVPSGDGVPLVIQIGKWR